MLQRPYTKGRDLFDISWYLSDPTWPEPNLILLNNALRQTNWAGEEITANNWRYITWQKLSSINWTAAVDDVRPFIEQGTDINLLTLDNIRRVPKV